MIIRRWSLLFIVLGAAGWVVIALAPPVVGCLVFAAGWCVIVVSIFAWLIEAWGVRRFWPRTFGRGLVVFRQVDRLPRPTAPVGSVSETNTGKIKVVAP